MSRERELLVRVLLSVDEDGFYFIDRELEDEITKLLSQPKKEQVVYQYRLKLPKCAFWSQWIECEVEQYKTYLSAPIKANLYGTLIEYQVRALYTSPPKREPLSEGVIDTYLDSYKGNKQSFWDGVEWAEKAHGITGEDE